MKPLVNDDRLFCDPETINGHALKPSLARSRCVHAAENVTRTGRNQISVSLWNGDFSEMLRA